MNKKVICLILGGGRGTRLYPLTEYRSKPAVPLAGIYRLIDIPISNCLNSGINRVYLLTQFNSVSLHRHVRQTYRFDRFHGGFVEILAAQQTMDGDMWYQGTADAVRQNMNVLTQPDVDDVLVLSGDQLYRMDLEKMLATHRAADADATIAALPVTDEAARGFGVMKLDDAGRIRSFLEKPQTVEEMDTMRTAPSWIDERGIEANGRSLLASMGIYAFKRDVLVDLLQDRDQTDFGKEIFPASIDTRNVHAHLFDGYWEDIGTIRSFFDANLALASDRPPFDLASSSSPIHTRARSLAPPRILDASLRNTLVSQGAFIESGTILDHSIVGLRCHVGKRAQIRNSILMGADYFEDVDTRPNGVPRVGIGDGTIIEGAIIDKDCRIGKNVKIRPREDLSPNCDIKGVYVRDGIIVVPKGATVPDGWEL